MKPPKGKGLNKIALQVMSEEMKPSEGQGLGQD
jgi:hypothetical protein